MSKKEPAIDVTVEFLQTFADALDLKDVADRLQI